MDDEVIVVESAERLQIGGITRGASQSAGGALLEPVALPRTMAIELCDGCLPATGAGRRN
jgi:hypothetical protein